MFIQKWPRWIKVILVLVVYICAFHFFEWVGLTESPLYLAVLITSLISILALRRNKKVLAKTAIESTSEKLLQATPHKVQDQKKAIPAITPEDFENAWASGDFDTARRWLQKMSYGMVDKNVTDTERTVFKRLVTEFADKDPLYADSIPLIKDYIERNPGGQQSKIYQDLPHLTVEEARYILYFAHELGDIIRVKKGRSYQLFLPSETIDV